MMSLLKTALLPSMETMGALTGGAGLPAIMFRKGYSLKNVALGAPVGAVGGYLSAKALRALIGSLLPDREPARALRALAARQDKEEPQVQFRQVVLSISMIPGFAAQTTADGLASWKVEEADPTTILNALRARGMEDNTDWAKVKTGSNTRLAVEPISQTLIKIKPHWVTAVMPGIDVTSAS
jgi:hypothetical protein